MLQDFTEVRNDVDVEGNPTGGTVAAKGLTINWQNGPLGRGEDRKEPSGTFVDTVIAAAKQRIQFYQDGKFACNENQFAIDRLNEALDILDKRTERREESGIEGAHAETLQPAPADGRPDGCGPVGEEGPAENPVV